MFNFFDSVINFFDKVITLIGNMLSSLYSFLSVISSTVQVASDLALGSNFPAFLQTAVIVVLAIAVIKLIFGRGNVS